MSNKPTKGRTNGSSSFRYESYNNRNDGSYYDQKNTRKRNYYNYPHNIQNDDVNKYNSSNKNIINNDNKYQKNLDDVPLKSQSAPNELISSSKQLERSNNDLKSKLPTAPKSMNLSLPSNSYDDTDSVKVKRRKYNGDDNDDNDDTYHGDHNNSNNNINDDDDDDDDVFARLNLRNNQDPVKPVVNTFKYMVKCNVVGYIHERIQQVGEGTYGKVYKGKNLITNELVALKKLRLEAEREGFPITSHREIGLLQSFDHQNIVGLYEIMVEKNQVFMVFPYMNHDLSGILQQSNIQITDGEKKNIFNQLLKGMEYLHSKRVIHRDVKGSNILIDNKGILKITDFGLARKMKNINEDLVSPNYTNRVITLWYRPPEILLGSSDYGREVDIWGVGCILMELFTRRAIFQGVNEIDQLWKVYDIMGTIKVEDWPEAYKLPWFEILRPNFKTEFKFKEKFGTLLSEECYNLAIELLRINPKKRITATLALKHKYFTEEPKIQPLIFLENVKGEWHEFEAKQKRKQKQKLQQQQQQQ